MFQYMFAVCTAMLCLCSGQSSPQSSSAALEEVRIPQHETWVQQNSHPDEEQTRLKEVGEVVDKGETQPDQAKDDMKTDDFIFWGYRPFYGRRWGGSWYGYPSWGWGWNSYRGWNGYGYGRRYPYYGYYW